MSGMQRSLLDRQQEEVEIVTNASKHANGIPTSQQDTSHLAEAQGNIINTKTEKTFRIGFININGLTHTARNPKNAQIKNLLETYEFDHFGMAETNCNWAHMETEDKWYERARKLWKKSKSKVVNNNKDISKEIKQPGGVVHITIGDAISGVIDSGGDTALGRWTWATFNGKQNIKRIYLSDFE